MTTTHPVFTDYLLAHPEDCKTRLVYADWLEEHGEVREAMLQRWLGAYERWPHYRPGPRGPRVTFRPTKPWGWYPFKFGTQDRDGKFAPGYARLIPLIYDELVGKLDSRRYAPYRVPGHVYYRTQREALDALAEALRLKGGLVVNHTRSMFA
jgi:uncharacterized protein (TIGR02996 family)